MKYSPGLKSKMVRKMAGPDRVSATALAQEVGIPQPTLSSWLRKAGTAERVEVSSAEGSKKASTSRRPQDWAPEEKLEAIIEARSLSEEDKGAFLRRKGLHEAQLKEWCTIVLAGLQKQPARPSPKTSAAEGRRIRELEKELERKDKALAEAAALLMLQKKVQALWGDGESATGKRSGR